MMKIQVIYLLFLAMLSLAIGGCKAQPPAQSNPEYDRAFTLRTAMQDGRMVYLGVGGTIEGDVNPDLVVQPGDTTELIIINGDGMPHDLAIPDLDVQIATVNSQGQTRSAVFEVGEAGSYTYYCTIPGHRQAGMEGKLVASAP
jgi:nitrite reductase (NO-forming)